MRPKFKDTIAWQQAELLMQPSLLRVVDNLRQVLETSPWKGTYEEVQDPYPGYVLCLTYQGEEMRVNLWELCFRICFLEYPMTHSPYDAQNVEIDTSLIDDTGDVDWIQLEEKTKQVIGEVFENLPKMGG
ncbi:hypothetical protein PN466_07905 [Roseofilum reptotaenium CS-1145]|uniref:Uncharacterized protein n=1 Tax=Roseofilum reptotaenium AO1-A TaxID=1925591 RepID=A0A1L9QQX3_9CYAN|nr:hypothetical protein [Roseofilum reptotaenium]MBP0028873.1 hypothetical protein [Roseofilum sp. Guam]MDB9516869.1 hypothetical protein [Roseofilum reptotaenium CS-1145]OJJ25095.1 hypothetical protein BI308_12940 [Roseofilum reptotaenium AO1-A]